VADGNCQLLERVHIRDLVHLQNKCNSQQ
jgi:hypothetical protein